MDFYDSSSSSSSDSRKSFLSHVFSFSDESKGEILNVIQYTLLGVIPVVALNKLVQRYIPEADPDKSSLELLVEIVIQLIVMFGGVILIHRIITYIPSYSGFKYDNLILTNVILTFLIIVLSIQTKLGIKVNILTDRLSDIWHGTQTVGPQQQQQQQQQQSKQPQRTTHVPSQADMLDIDTVGGGGFPPLPVNNNRKGNSGGGGNAFNHGTVMDTFIQPANALLGSAFGSSF